MKRDIALIRRILLLVEADETPFTPKDGHYHGLVVSFDDVPLYTLAHHVHMLSAAGLVHLRSAEHKNYDRFEDLENHGIPRIVQMTWKGYDYLDSIREAD